MANRFVSHYAKSVHEQVNPNAAKRNKWSDLAKAVSKDGTSVPSGSGVAAFTYTVKNVKSNLSNPFAKAEVVYNFPYVVTAHQFDLNIPSNAYISKVTFTVCMKVSKGVTAKVPKAVVNAYGSAWNSGLNTGNTTGWINGAYHIQPNVNLSTSYKEVNYVMSESVLNQGGITPHLLNQAITGIDLNFSKCDGTEGNIYIKWVRASVEYDIPDNRLSFNVPSSPDNPFYVSTGRTFTVAALHFNNSNAIDGDQYYPVKLPQFGYDVVTDPVVTDTWVVDGKPNNHHVLYFNVKPHILGLNSIEVGWAKLWFYALYGDGDDYSVVTITPQILRKAVNGCIQVNAHVFDEDGVVNFTVDYDVGHNDPPMKFNFNGQLSSQGVFVRSITSNSISFNIPPRTECDVCFEVCATPVRSGTCTFKVTDDDGDVYTQDYTVLPPYVYRFCNRDDGVEDTFDLIVAPSEATFSLERVVTKVDGMYELDAIFNEETMYMTPCNITASKFDKLNYVGCVPLTHSHFDPKSDYTDTLLNETYKNKTYMGKKGVIDETITLNLRVPPRDVTTLQGLVEMDKPVPINTCYTAFEGDALNHRGWVELYGVKDVEKTNPNYYKIALDVKYLTHNIACKFDILRHGKVTDAPLPTLFAETLSFDEPLSNGLNVEDEEGNLIESSDFFEIDTDGTYQFIDNVVSNIIDDNDDEPDGDEEYSIYNSAFSNLFNLGEGQHIRLTSHNSLSQNVKISCNWQTNKRGGNSQNNSVKRVFRLRDAFNKDNVLFEYTYYDFNFEQDDFVKARVTSTYTGTEDNVKTLFSSEIAVKSDIDYNEEYPEIIEEVWYGSTVIFELKGNVMTVTDTGYNGRELYGSCELKNGSYIFECEFTNNLTQSFDEDCFVHMDMEVLDTVLQAKYAELYSNLVVSPYPVINKNIVFSRYSEEGTIYYMRDDDKPFKYLLEPYYQYHCGVDLKTREGISIFDLNNSYSIFYMQNGLVRIGFSRIDGEVYLSKYDPTSQEYVNTHVLKLNADVKFDTGILNDDKIEILADTMVFTMWRGHPYIMVNHPNNDIQIKHIFTKVFGETNASGLPSLINLMNEDNLLPVCVGGSKISSKCVETSVNRENIVESHTIEVIPMIDDTPISDDITQDTEVEFDYLFDGASDSSVADNVRFIVGGLEILGNTYTFNQAGVFSIYAVYLGDDLNQFAVSSSVDVKVVAPIVGSGDGDGTQPGTPEYAVSTNTGTIKGKFKLECDIKNNTKFHYRSGEKVKFTLTRGGTPIAGKVVEIAYPNGQIGTTTTDASGQIIISNAGDNWDVKPRYDPYYLMATFYDYGDEDHDTKVMYQKKVTIFIIKQRTAITMTTPATITKNTSAKFQFTVEGKPRSGYALTVSKNGGNVKVYHTNDNGEISVKLSKKGTYKFRVGFAGTTYKYEHTLLKNVKVN